MCAREGSRGSWTLYAGSEHHHPERRPAAHSAAAHCQPLRCAKEETTGLCLQVSRSECRHFLEGDPLLRFGLQAIQGRETPVMWCRSVSPPRRNVSPHGGGGMGKRGSKQKEHGRRQPSESRQSDPMLRTGPFPRVMFPGAH